MVGAFSCYCRVGLKLPTPVTPPPIIGLANGVAQSIVSLARGFGPLLGGYVSTVFLSRYDQISPTLLSLDMVRNGTRKPVELLRRVRDGRCGVFVCNRPQLFHPLKHTVSAFWLLGGDGWCELKSDNDAIHMPFTPLDICPSLLLFIDSARFTCGSVYE